MNNQGNIQKASLSDKIKILLRSKSYRYSPTGMSRGGLKYCYVCGQRKKFSFVEIINKELQDDWALTSKIKDQFDIRESTVCETCKCSLRSNLHARALLKVINAKDSSLTKAIENGVFSNLRIGEINSCGALHRTLSNISNIYYSEYNPEDKNVRKEDMTNLSYDDSFFDIVLTSETLEHIPDIDIALKEIYRVLKPGGYHIFTIPAILNRRTRKRVSYKNGEITHILKKSFHGCSRNISSLDYVVCNEFGVDVIDFIDSKGFETCVYFINIFNFNDPNIVFVSRKNQ